MPIHAEQKLSECGSQYQVVIIHKDYKTVSSKYVNTKKIIIIRWTDILHYWFIFRCLFWGTKTKELLNKDFLPQKLFSLMMLQVKTSWE